MVVVGSHGKEFVRPYDGSGLVIISRVVLPREASSFVIIQNFMEG